MQQPKFIKELQPLEGLDTVGVNFLPCTISTGGPCPSEEYFKPIENKVVIHGRELEGHRVTPPKPLYIFQQQNDGTRAIRAEVNEFTKWIYYGTPQRNQQLVEYTKLLDVLRKPIK